MRFLRRLCFALALSGLAVTSQPANAQKKELPEVPVEAPRVPQPAVAPELPPEQPQQPDPLRGISWSSDAIRSDTDRVGPWNQPVWTTQRPFTTTRTYVLPDGTMQLEQWYRPRWKKDGTREDRVLEEFAVGLPYRLQLDVYARWNIKPNDGGDYRANWEATQIELRWAFANWGVIPLNPTAYVEWVQRGNTAGEPDKYEIKLLLADEFFKGKLFFAGNFNLEKEVGGAKENELSYSQAFATTLIERRLMGGIEMWYRAQNVNGSRGTWNNEFIIGPTLQLRPTNRTFVDATALFGTTPGSPKYECYFILGYQFGRRAGPASGFQGITPSSLGN
ncbi:MAG: hypothetical protein K2R98_06245 [Gemmataceae bacterium]|nr:hypothetical protein [Gemmataceae bacterium]